MGAWGPGNFENDDALDLLGELESSTDWNPIAEIFTTLAHDAAQGAEIDATDAARALAGADLLAARRGHLSPDIPDNAAAILIHLGAPPPDLHPQAVDAVSYVISFSELTDLWAESDDPGEWNVAQTGLIERLSAKPRTSPPAQTSKRKMSAYECAFCLELIPVDDLVELNVRHSSDLPGISRSIYAHLACLNSRLHPKRIIQPWSAETE